MTSEGKVGMATPEEIRQHEIHKSEGRIAESARDIEKRRRDIAAERDRLSAAEDAFAAPLTGSLTTRADQRRTIDSIRLSVDNAEINLRATERAHEAMKAAHEAMCSGDMLDAFAAARADVSEQPYLDRVLPGIVRLARGYVEARAGLAMLVDALTDHASRVQNARMLEQTARIAQPGHTTVPDHGLVGGYDSAMLVSRVLFEALRQSGQEPFNLRGDGGAMHPSVMPMPMPTIGEGATVAFGPEKPEFTALLKTIAERVVGKAER
jgi:hypothetical protein